MEGKCSDEHTFANTTHRGHGHTTKEAHRALLNESPWVVCTLYDGRTAFEVRALLAAVRSGEDEQVSDTVILFIVLIVVVLCIGGALGPDG
jgi:hypothetical protein